MIISNEEIIKHARGFVRVEEHDGFLRFSRFTKAQADLLEQRGFTPREKASSGIMLEFISSTKEISFRYRIGAGSGQVNCGIDLYVNGINTYTDYKQESTGEYVFKTSIVSDGNSLITIFFPALSFIEITELEVESIQPAPRRKLKYLALGDSITHGYCSKHPSLIYANILAQKLNAEIYNQAIGGDIFFADNLDPALKDVFMPNLITVAYGTNDWSRGVDVYASASAYFKRLREIYDSVPIFALLPIHRGNEEVALSNGVLLDHVRYAISKAAEENGIIPVNCRDAVPWQEDYFCDKTLHPGEIGFMRYADYVYDAIMPHLKGENKLFLKTSVKGKIRGNQDGAIYNGMLFRLSSRGVCDVYSVKDIAPEGTERIAKFTFDTENEPVPHANAVMFSDRFYYPDDEFPLLYTGIYNNYAREEDKMIGVCCVYRIYRKDDSFGAKMVQLIKLDFCKDPIWASATGDIRPFGNFVVDNAKNRLVAMNMMDDERITRYFTFDLPDSKAGVPDGRWNIPTVTLTKADIIDFFDTPYHSFLQGATMKDGLVYSLEGGIRCLNALSGIRVVDVEKRKQIFYSLMTDHLPDHEPEFIDFDGDELIYSDGHGNTYTFEFEELL